MCSTTKTHQLSPPVHTRKIPFRFVLILNQKSVFLRQKLNRTENKNKTSEHCLALTPTQVLLSHVQINSEIAQKIQGQTTWKKRKTLLLLLLWSK